MADIQRYGQAVEAIKEAILRSQAAVAKDANERLLLLYFAVGRFVSENTRSGAWGTGAVEFISEQLQKELPGLRGFSARNLRYMRDFYEEWALAECVDDSNFALASAKLNSGTSIPILHLQVQNWDGLTNEEFFGLGFTHHRTILESVKDPKERVFYIREAARNHYSVETLKRAIREDDFHHQGSLSNNFQSALGPAEQAQRAVLAFKDEYLLDFINVEPLGMRDKDVDERMLEQGIVQNIKEFILKFGHDFAFIGNQYRIEAFGEEQFIDLLFFNRELNSLVAVELKTGPFKTAYLGQLNGYLSLLDEFVRKPHENQSIGIVLCRDANKAFVDFVIRDYDKPLGVATYKTSRDISKEVLDALPPIDDLKSLLESEDAE